MMDEKVVVTFAIAFTLPLLALYFKWATGKGLYAIPTIGPSLPGLAYISALNTVKHARGMIQEGYIKYKGSTFKIPLVDRWLVVVSGTQLIEELRKMPDDKMSFLEAAADLVQTKYTFGPTLHHDPYHVDIVRNQLTRHIANIFPAVHEEIVSAFSDLIPAKEEWVSIPALQVMRTVVARVSNRVFVGLPMCRNEEYLKLAVFHTMDVSKTRNTLSLIPDILKPLVGPFVNSSQRTMKRATSLLEPMIQERFRDFNAYGKDWSDKPDDVLQWIIDEALARKQNVEDVVGRVMLMNFAAIHTSSNSFTHALYHLAANPEYIAPLRQEVEGVIEKEDWTKAAMNKLRKLDSFLRESQRLNGISSTSLSRKAMKDVTLSNGTFVPAGTLCVAAAAALHTDDDNYVDADVFNPFRFSDMREEEGEGTKHQFVSTSADYISFGHGKHACPGRFFAANELKAMMAHIVISYDIKFENEGIRPPNVPFSLTLIPAPTAKVLFRKRTV